MISRFYAEKKQGFDREARALFYEIGEVLGIKTVEKVRILYRYTAESARPLPFLKALGDGETAVGMYAGLAGARVFASEPFGGGADGVSEAAEARLRLYTEEPFTLRAAKVYAIYGSVSEEELAAIKALVLRPEGRREASLALPAALAEERPARQAFENVFGFRDLDMGGLESLIKQYDLDMTPSQLVLLQKYFKSEYRDPTMAEIVLFGTLCREGKAMLSATIDEVDFGDETLKGAYGEYLAAREELGEEGPATLGDIATVARRLLQKRGGQEDFEEVGQIPAIVVKTPVGEQTWALTLTEGALRPECSYAVLKLDCAQDPLSLPVAARKDLCAAAEREAEELRGAGIATAEVAAVYHEGYEGPLSIGIILAAGPAEGFRYAPPVPGDRVILVGGMPHTSTGEKIRRLFNRQDATALVKCSRPVGAEGVVPAAASLADGVDLDLDEVFAANTGMGEVGTVRFNPCGKIAVVTEAREAENFVRFANEEGLDAAAIATVTEIPRLIVRQGGKVIVNLSHAFMMNCGAEQRLTISSEGVAALADPLPVDFTAGMRAVAGDINLCSRRDLCERFDSAVGGKAVLAPFCGEYASTPPQAAVSRILPEGVVGYTAWGGDPGLAEKSPYRGAYLAVVESISKLVATGADFKDIHLLLTHTFPREGGEDFWARALAALLGACKAQLDLGVAAMGEGRLLQRGKVPPATYCIASVTGMEREVIAPAFKGAGHKVVLLAPSRDADGLPVSHSLIKNFKIVTALMRAEKVLAAYAVGRGGVAEAIVKCCLGNEIGFRFADMVPMETVFGEMCGAFILELNDETAVGEEIGRTTLSETVARGLDLVPLVSLRALFEGKLSPVYGEHTEHADVPVANLTSFKKSTYIGDFKGEKPRVLLPVFAGMSGAEEAARAFVAGGAEAEICYVKTGALSETAASLKTLAARIAESDILYLADGKEGDHVCGLGKYIATCLRFDDVKTEIEDLLDVRNGLVGGTGIGFEALLELGLLPYGKFTEPGENSPKIAGSIAGHSIFRTLRVRISSAASPWLAGMNAGDVFTVSARIGGGISLDGETAERLAQNGQILAQFADFEGNASMDARANPAGSAFAIDGLLSPDGRIIGTFTDLLCCRRKYQIS